MILNRIKGLSDKPEKQGKKAIKAGLRQAQSPGSST
jgi:hypothetical protein